MTALVIALVSVVLVLLIAFSFAKAAAQRQLDIAAKALAETFARDARKQAEEKAARVADEATKEVIGATHEELERIARDLAARK